MYTVLTKNNTRNFILLFLLLGCLGVLYLRSAEVNCFLFCYSHFEDVGSGSANGYGISKNRTGTALLPSIAISPNDTPYIAWAYYYGHAYQNASVQVSFWDGQQWENIRENVDLTYLASSPFATHPVLDFAPNGTLYLAWSGKDRIHVERFVNNQWQAIDEGLMPSVAADDVTKPEAHNPSIAVGLDDSVYIAWESSLDNQRQISVRYWNGQSWTDRDCGLTDNLSDNSQHQAQNPVIVSDAKGGIYLAWSAVYKGIPFVYVKKWDGSCWHELGADSASGTGLGQGGNTTLALASDGSLYVAWLAVVTGKTSIQVRKWNTITAKWEDLNFESSTIQEYLNRSKQYPNIATATDGSLYLTWVNSDRFGEEIAISRWNGDSWTNITTLFHKLDESNTSKHLESPVMALTSDGDTYIAWLSSDSVLGDSNRVFVRYADN